MTAAQQGFLLLSSDLGDPRRKPLTTAQLRTLGKRVRTMEKPTQDRDMLPRDLVGIGYSQQEAERILRLLSDRELLEYYLHKAKKAGCMPVTPVSKDYPPLLRERLADDCPGCLWAKGDLSLLKYPAVSLVGSRNINAKNAAFAEAVGSQAAKLGFVLISGNARGADTIAQEACLKAGGKVISVVADALQSHAQKENVLYLAEESFDAAFSPRRALSRNRMIHSMGLCVFVAQSDVGKSGTWNGTVNNLRHGWSPVYCYDDESAAATELEQLGAQLIAPEELTAMEQLAYGHRTLFDK